ncbi:MAG: excinuclease ABC subunit UvrA [Phycisphaerae bacterium]
MIRVIGARQHNLQNVSIDIPRDKLVVITGLSGSGKSSLAFDTIHAEGQRKYVESLSVHARMFLEQVGKPDVERIDGLPPTLAIEQLASAPNPRSTVATTTEIYDFLRLLFARCGRPHCPTCGTVLQRRTVDQIVDSVLAYPPDTRVMILAPLIRGNGDHKEAVRQMQREGFVRARVNGELIEVKDLAESAHAAGGNLDVVIDRIQVRPDARHRIADAVELSLRLAEGRVVVSHSNGVAGGNGVGGAITATAQHANGTAQWVDAVFSESPACMSCGLMIAELEPRMFSFNSPYGACGACGGLGTMLKFDPDLVIPDPDQTLAGSAIAPWAGAGKALGGAYAATIKQLCDAFGVKASTAFRNLPDDLKRIVLHGTTLQDSQTRSIEFEGVIPILERRTAQEKPKGEDGASRLSEFQSEHPCDACGGGRLRPESLAVRIAAQNIFDVTQLSIRAALRWFDGLKLTGEHAQIAEPITREVSRRLSFMDEVGLHYLTLERASATLSGGEAQRLRLATQLGSGLVGVCYVLDEPTIGLHQRDNERLIASMRRLVEIGNTVIVVEHDEDVIRAADHLIDIGPGAGLHGGRVMSEGPTAKVLADPNSITGRYLCGEYEIPLPDERRKAKRDEWIKLENASENNLKAINAEIPLGSFVAITGVSGSGKSTLIGQTLVPALRKRLSAGGGAPQQHGLGPQARAGALGKIVGANRIDRIIEIDQTPIGRTPRSNPATYTGVFDEIRTLYAKTKEARIRGYNGSRFSFNAKGGRCEACQGQGTRKIEMHFMADLFVECAECKGTRYNRETLEIRYRGKSIADVLEMRIEETLKFFDSFPKIKAGVQALSDVGLGYVRLGQPSNTLSGGEAQRVKLAAELCKPATGRTLYVLDEPTTGLHFADIHTLLSVLNRLVDMGNTVLVIEHNLDVIKTADWVIDLGPEGGDAGGQIVVAGTPEQVGECAASHTGRYLKAKLK